jgi:hypothetical protein
MVMGDLPLSVHPHHGIHEKKATVSATGMGCAPNHAVVAVIAAEAVGPTPVVVATAQVETSVVPMPAVAGMAAAEAAVPSPAGVDGPSHAACGAVERPPSQTTLLHERRALYDHGGDDARCKGRSAQPASR